MAAPPAPGLTTVRTADQLSKVATSDVDQSIAQQTAPLQAQSDTLTGDEASAGAAIKNMFGSILPAVSTGAANVKSAYDEATVNQNAIFSAAQAQLNQIKQSQAQRGQALAQEIGGPVALSEFTAGSDAAQTLLSNLGAGQMLHTLGYAQAGEQQAQDFAGQVFPLIQTEQQAQNQKYFEDQKKTLQDQITQLKSTRGDKITTEKNDLISQERTYALQKTQQALDKIKQQQDHAATLRTLSNDDKRVAIAQKAAALQESGVTGTYKGKPTQQAKALTAQEKLQARQMNLTTQQYQDRKAQIAASTKYATARLNASNRQTWAQYLDAGVNPQPGKTVKQTVPEPVDAPSAFGKKDPNVIQVPVSKQFPSGYARLTTVYNTPTNAPITNPNQLTDYLVAHNVPQTVAVRMVKARLGIPGWSYGKPDPNAPKAPPKVKGKAKTPVGITVRTPEGKTYGPH